MISHVTLLSIPVADQDRARTFYETTLGFELLRDEPMGPTMRWVHLRPRGGQTEVTLVSWFDAMSPGSLQGLMLETDDIDGEHARLIGLGLRLSPIERQSWGRFTMFSDPDGNGLILRQPLAS